MRHEILFWPVIALCWLLRKLGWTVMLYPDHFGHQCGDIEYDLRTKTGQSLLYFAGVIPNKALWTIHKRSMRIVRLPSLIRRWFIFAELECECFDEPLSRDLRIYGNGRTWHALEAQLRFSEDEQAYGDGILADLGIQKGKYVCFHARDPQYGTLNHPKVMDERGFSQAGRMTEECNYQRLRNANFLDYDHSITWLAEHGIESVRVGADVEQPYYFMHGLVEYAAKRKEIDNPELADLYIMAHCLFSVGQNTGVTLLALSLNRPIAGVNWFPYSIFSRLPIGPNLCRAKRVTYQGKQLTELESKHFFDGSSWDELYEAANHIQVTNNTPQHILDVVQQTYQRVIGEQRAAA